MPNQIAVSAEDGTFIKHFQYYWGQEFTGSIDEYRMFREYNELKGNFELSLRSPDYLETNYKFELQDLHFSEEGVCELSLGEINLKYKEKCTPKSQSQ